MEHRDLYCDSDKHADDVRPVNRKPGAAITSMALGISSVSLWWYPFITSIPCIIMGIIAVVLANRSQRDTDPKFNGFLKAGRITGTIGIIVASVYTFIMIIVFASAFSGGCDSYYYYW